MNTTGRGWLRTIAVALAAAVAGCGGSGSNPFDNPPEVSNPPQTSGRKLSFEYFQRCVYPVLQAQLPININGVVSTNSCAASGCHDNVNGTGGALRIFPAGIVELASPANTPEAIRTTDMYKNFYSAQGETVIGSPESSRLVNKPLIRGVLHGGGLIFPSDQDPNARLFAYWIRRPMPQGQDEFGSAGNSMFTPPDPASGSCNVE
jgi:hypothetical protein